MYKLNNILLDTYGIIPGRVKGEGIAVKGIFDLPKRIGITHKDWDDTNGVEPYVDADELFFAGRDIIFAGILIGNRAATKAQIALLKADISLFNAPVPFETPYGTACVKIKKITPKFYNSGATIEIEMREPVVGNVCAGAGEETIYYSEEYSETAIKNNCDTGYFGSEVTLTATAGQFNSTISQQAANLLAINWVRENKQTYANVHGTCTINPPVYYNVELTETLTRNNCGEGYFGSTVTYTVPAYKYSSLVSEADANAKAQAEIDANLTQEYANSVGTCNLSPSFIKIFDEVSGITTNYGSGGNIREQRFEVGPAVIPGTKYNIMLYGIYFAYTATIGDTPWDVVNYFLTAINAMTDEQWNANNQAPTTAVSGFKPSAFSFVQNVLKIYMPESANAECWIGNPPWWDNLQS